MTIATLPFNLPIDDFPMTLVRHGPARARMVVPALEFGHCHSCTLSVRF
nr:hypothetical protein [Variovorax boronicumulans]